MDEDSIAYALPCIEIQDTPQTTHTQPQAAAVQPPSKPQPVSKARWAPRLLAAHILLKEVYILVSTLYPLVDTIFHVIVAVHWLRRPGYGDYARISFALFGFSTGLPTVVSLALALLGARSGQPGLRGLFIYPILFALNVQLCCTLPSDNMALLCDPSIKASMLIPRILKTYTVFAEACPQLLLQFYVAVYEYYTKSTPTAHLQVVSMVISFITIGMGVVAYWFSNESLRMQYLAWLFIQGMVVARFSAFVAAFVVFGWYIWIAMLGIIALRASAVHALCFQSLRATWRDRHLSIDDYINAASCYITCVVLTVIPIGTRSWEDLLFPHPPDSAGPPKVLSETLHSTMGILNCVLHFIENTVLFVLVVALPSRQKRVDLRSSFVLLFGPCCMLVAVVSYTIAFFVMDCTCHFRCDDKGDANTGVASSDGDEEANAGKDVETLRLASFLPDDVLMGTAAQQQHNAAAIQEDEQDLA